MAALCRMPFILSLFCSLLTCASASGYALGFTASVIIISYRARERGFTG